MAIMVMEYFERGRKVKTVSIVVMPCQWIVAAAMVIAIAGLIVGCCGLETEKEIIAVRSYLDNIDVSS
jgi:hypothetical protein